MDVVKQRLQLKVSPYNGVLNCLRRVAMDEGTWAFYSSYRTTVIMNAPFTAVHFTTYEAAKRALFEISPEKSDDGKVMVHATAGAAAVALAAVVTSPLDVVKTRLQCQGPGSLWLRQICDEFDRESDSESGEERWLCFSMLLLLLFAGSLMKLPNPSFKLLHNQH